ncbi:aldehyde dehydrogenase cytochrome c subunit [Ameyamaea chiangmaiensis NBRC 103196]|uniref:C-type cytochrome n=1 Tax=Ameyamaea chiangmaiensis TaxID=442969 RepID=A0A850P5Z9_9PROT|nr:cytochrome c [Ameyamaea chiangmaiensis]MBS4073612.1 c-type cytochrome [Ameyamaea chiangmaiensis]NVN40047.1 c-type cytochrome [Ameyamaea chiangmaiensis]GBQ69075.1 aldehyde dehydrogenase cytochrome c subunit [Ameyamaea chiangmaiensis NBRC 103196]
MRGWFARLASTLFVLSLLVAKAHGADTSSQIARGEYLARASDCEVCHTAPGGTPFAGGRPFKLPGIGTIYSTNLTPDRATGVGDYTDAQFARAVRRGVGRGWKHLYPVMPYTSYAYLSADDTAAIFAWLKTLRPVTATIPANDVGFPYNIRAAMIGWNLLYRPSAGRRDDPSRSAAWNQGRWLVEGPGHCAECHTPRNMLYAKSSSQPYAGGQAEEWDAYNISSDPESGIGGWSDESLFAYLHTGHADGHGTASGPMADVISHGVRYMTDEDVHAMITYLRTLPQQRTNVITDRVSPERLARIGTPTEGNGARLFAGACAGCHLTDGTGRQVPYATLWGARTVGLPGGRNLVQVILHGSALETSMGRIAMPQVGDEYSDRDIADIANYVIGHFGNRAGTVTPQAVQAALANGD